MVRIRLLDIKKIHDGITQEAFGDLLVPPVGQTGVQGWATARGGKFRKIDIDSVRRLADFWKKTVTEFMHEQGGILEQDGVEALMDIVQARMRAIRRIDPQTADSPDRALYRKLFDRIPNIEMVKRAGNTRGAIAAYDRCVTQLTPHIISRLVKNDRPADKPADVELAMVLFEILAEALTLRMHAYRPDDEKVFATYIAAMDAITRDERWSPFSRNGNEQDDKGEWQIGFLLLARLCIAKAQFAYLSKSENDALKYIADAEEYSKAPYMRKDIHIRLMAAALKAAVSADIYSVSEDVTAWDQLQDARNTLRDLEGTTGDVIAETIAAAYVYRSLAQVDSYECVSCVKALDDLLAGLDGLGANHLLARNLVEESLRLIRKTP